MGSQSCRAPDATDEFPPIDMGHEHVADHEVGNLALHLGETCSPVFGDAHVEAASSEERGQSAGDRLVVVDEQDVRTFGRDPWPSAPPQGVRAIRCLRGSASRRSKHLVRAPGDAPSPMVPAYTTVPEPRSSSFLDIVGDHDARIDVDHELGAGALDADDRAILVERTRRGHGMVVVAAAISRSRSGGVRCSSSPVTSGIRVAPALRSELVRGAASCGGVGAASCDGVRARSSTVGSTMPTVHPVSTGQR